MAVYVVRRFGAVLLIMVAMSVLVFLATHALPSNAAALILGQYSTPETQAALEHKLGFDLPLPVQYWHWARGILEGDIGQSLDQERPVAPMLWDAFGRSAILALSSLAVVAGLGLSRRSSPILVFPCPSSTGVSSLSSCSAARFTCCLRPATPTFPTGLAASLHISCCQSQP